MGQRTCVGLDVHARSVVACVIDRETGEIHQSRFVGAGDLSVVRWVDALPGPVLVAYEAGPTGFGLARAFAAAGIDCQVVAPSKLLPRPGDRVKTDRRDARHLAELLVGGLTTPIHVPSVEQEAARDLVRAREDVRCDLMRARHRLSKLLLRHGLIWDGSATWGKAHLEWIGRQRLNETAARAALDNDLLVVRQAIARRDMLDQTITELAIDSQFASVVKALGCLRGVAALTGFALAVEIGDWGRFTGRSIASFVGLVPSEHSSGTSRNQGGITKAGNGHARRLLVEAAWHHRRDYRPNSRKLAARSQGVDPAIVLRASQGNQRLNSQWQRFDARGKRPVVANAAIARQLAGWCWSLATMVQTQ